MARSFIGFVIMLKKNILKIIRILIYDRPVPLIFILLILMITYFAIGSYRYWILGPFDLHDRWAEIQYFIRGIDPFDIVMGTTEDLSEIGKVSSYGGYVPWAYILALPLVPPLPYGVVKFWYFGVMLFSFLITFFLFYQYCRRLGLSCNHSLLISSAALCNWGLVYGLRWGQYSLPVLAALTVYMIAIERNKPILGGVSLSIAMIKPQVAFLFGFVAIAKKKWRLLAVAIFIVITSWIAVAAWLDKSIWSLLAVKANQNTAIGYYYGLFNEIIINSQHRELWILSSGIFFIILMVLVTFLQSGRSITYHMAIAGLASTMWTYSGPYDSIVLSFLICYLLLQYYFKVQNFHFMLLLFASAILVWQPTGISHGIIWPVPIIMRTVWVTALYLAITSEKPVPLMPKNVAKDLNA